MLTVSPAFPVDLSLFEGTRHSPSLPMLERSMGRSDLKLQDFCIPVNPYFPTAGIFAAFKQHLESILKYYPGSNGMISRTLADALGLDPDTVVMGNGSTELITWIDELFIGDRIVTPIPTFGSWIDHPTAIGKSVYPWKLRPELSFRWDVDGFVRFVQTVSADSVVICNPNNPTGTFLDQRSMIDLLDVLSDRKLIVIDESFIDFAQEESIPSVAGAATKHSNVIVLKSLGKNCGLHGVRAGYAVAHPDLVRRLRRALPQWNVNAMAEALIRAFADHPLEYEIARRRAVADRRHTEASLSTLEELTVFPSWANFVYAQVPRTLDGVRLRDWLLCEYGFLVRECSNKMGSDSSYFRIASRPFEQIDSLATALRSGIQHFRDLENGYSAKPRSFDLRE